MNRDSDDQPLTRQAYRQAQAAANRHQDDYRRGRSVSDLANQLLHRDQAHARTEVEPPANSSAQRSSRAQAAATMAVDAAEEKTARLKHKLNVAILALIVAIVLVYLILFFVG